MNPILNNLNSKTSPNLMSILKSGNPDAIVNQLMRTNPQFRKFINDNAGKSPEQIAKEHGINLNEAMSEVQGLANKFKR